MSYDYSENILVQNASADLLQKMGWDVVFAYNTETLGTNGKLGRETYKEVLLSRFFRKALFENNNWINEDLATEAEKIFTSHIASNTLLQTNQDKYKLIKNGIPLSIKKSDGTFETKKARIINFDDPHKNHFLAVKELKIHGTVYHRRTDIVGFVNGIPLLFIELKKPTVDVKNAYTDNYTDYQKTIPQLFHYNAAVILSNGLDAKIGSLGSKYAYFQNWKRLKEDDSGAVDLETMLKGICDIDNFIDILENFILFDASGGKTTKILARNHQYLGVNEAIKAYTKRDLTNGKLGVFWHTQGSGKSYSMIFFTEKIKRRFTGSPTFVILTDRNELNKQIGGTFEACGCLDGVKQNTVNPKSGNDLIRLLKGNHTYIFTLIEKFNEPNPDPIIPNHDILIISDEAHRSQNGFYAENMCSLLPTASRIGFTGTPLFTYDEITKRTFGDYVSIYDFKRAVEDGATVPLYYENRANKLKIENPKINEELLEAIENVDLDVKSRARLEHDLKREYHILTSKKRLDIIAQDFVNHYSGIWTVGKAMFVAIDKITTVKMYLLIQKYWAEKIIELEQELICLESDQQERELRAKILWMQETEMAVVISDEQNEQRYFEKHGIDILPIRKKINTRELDKEFKDEDNKFRVVFVCAMWLTGFDVKCLSALYLDKPLKAHTLMQAIARANRINEGKTNGLIVAYADIVEPLKKALFDYTDSGNSTENPLIDKEQLIVKIKDILNEITVQLNALGFSISKLIESVPGFERVKFIQEAENAVCTTNDTKKQFEILAGELFKLWKYTERNEITDEMLHQKNAVSAIYGSLHKKTSSGDDFIDLTIHLQAIIDNYIEIEPEDEGKVKEYDISMIDFDKISKKFKSVKYKNLIMQDIQDMISKRLDTMMRKNPNRVNYYTHYQEIIEEYNKNQDKSEIEEIFMSLLKLVEDLGDEEKRYIREDFENDEELAIYDMLVNDSLTAQEIKSIKKLSTNLLNKIKDKIRELDHWQEKEETQAAVKNLIRDTLWYNLPELYLSNLPDFEKIRLNLFDYVITTYPAA